MGISSEQGQRTRRMTTADPMVVIERLTDRPGLRIAGEIDQSNCAVLHRMLASCRTENDIHLDLAGLQFIDVAGVALLALFAHRAVTGAPPRRLVLHAPPYPLRRIAELLWPDPDWEIDQP